MINNVNRSNGVDTNVGGAPSLQDVINGYMADLVANPKNAAQVG